MDEARLNLTRRFRTEREARDEAESNLSSGSLWVPLEVGAERPALLRAVLVTLHLQDGTALEPLRGRVTCLAPAGVAVVLDDLPPAVVLTRLLGGLPPPPPSDELAPEDAPPLPAGLEDPGWQPIGSAAPSAPPPAPFAPSLEPPRLTPPPIPDPVPPAPPEPSAIDPPSFAPPASDPPSFAPPSSDPPSFAPPPSDPPPFAPPSIDPPSFAPPSSDPPSFAPPPSDPPSFAPPSSDPPSFAPPSSDPPPFEPPSFEPPSSLELPPLEPSAMSLASDPPPTLVAAPDASSEAETADFPMMREQPVPAVAAPADMWVDDGSLDPDLKMRPAEDEAPAEPARPKFSVRYMDGEALEKAWKGELGAGRVMLTAPESPAMETIVEVTLLLPDVGALVLEGTVVHRSGNGIGVRLEMDAATRSLIESALPSKETQAPAAPTPPIPAPPPASSPPPVATPRRPSMELRTDAVTGRTILVLAFETLADFRREYETNIRRGGVMVPTAERPPVRSVIDIVFSLLGGKREVKLKGEVVLHGPNGIGLQLGEVPAATRLEIDSLIAAAGSPSENPAPAAAIVPPPAPSSAPPPPRGAPPAGAAPVSGAPGAARPRATIAPAGAPFDGDLVEVMREAEVEGEAGVSGLAAKSSWLKVLAHLQATRASGILRAVRKAETKSFLVAQGRLLDARGAPSRDDESMLRVVRKNNLAKPGVLRVLDRALDKATDEIKALEAANIWSPAEIDRARRWQVLERASEVFAWEKGRFEFDPNGDRSWARTTSGVPVGHVILHGVRSYLRASGEDLSRILRGGLDRVIKVVSGTGFEPARVGMTDKELKFWAEIDGRKTLRQLLAASPVAQTQAHRVVFALCRLGVLTFERGAGVTAKKDGAERLEVLKARLAELKTRDPFGKLSVSWMSAGAQVQAGWEATRRDLENDLRAPGAIGETAREILALCEAAWRLLMDERTRRLQRLKLIEDPSRIEAAADMLADRAELLRLQGDKAGAESALQMALDMAPGNGGFLQQLARVRAG